VLVQRARSPAVQALSAAAPLWSKQRSLSWTRVGFSVALPFWCKDGAFFADRKAKGSLKIIHEVFKDREGADLLTHYKVRTRRTSGPIPTSNSACWPATNHPANLPTTQPPTSPTPNRRTLTAQDSFHEAIGHNPALVPLLARMADDMHPLRVRQLFSRIPDEDLPLLDVACEAAAAVEDG
jgi:hypothetical protein